MVAQHKRTLTGGAITLAVVMLAVTTLTGCGASAPASRNTLTVLTRNMDEGTDFGPLVKAKTAGQFLAAAATAWEEVEASDIPERAAGIADEIVAHKPDLVSIEEAAIWRTGPLLKGPASTVVYDALGSLQSALTADGAKYRLVVVESEFDLEGPTSLGYDVRVTDEDAILARSNLRLSDVQSGHFHNQLTLTPVGVKETILRGWTSVDVTVGGKTVRYVETHLESFSNSVQKAQAGELLAGPAHTTLPVILACDCNTGPGVTPTYNYILSKGGFTDTWTVTNPKSRGFTWPLHKEDPYVATATPTERIDLVLVKGAITLMTDKLIGNTRASLTPSGLWPSDHAGVLAVLAVS
jgi:endonuclease/exonuclease/phosphatase family metal-dependent hydrolase